MSVQPKTCLTDILEQIDAIGQFIKGHKDAASFSKDQKAVYACARALEILGEAAKNLPKEMTEKYPEIPWKNIIGMRDKLIHAYSGIDLEILWKTASERAPEIRPAIRKMLQEQEKEEKKEETRQGK
ncbi:DUF86 domain-containing protein [Candidatus Micrarchaeota archaeon]|nr:DUF86 domain-containing protein [Candidatus Micrarchaeota archaeon]